MATSTYDILFGPDNKPRVGELVTIDFVDNGTLGLSVDSRIIAEVKTRSDSSGRWSIPGPIAGPEGSYYKVIINGEHDVYFKAPNDDGNAHWVGDLLVVPADPQFLPFVPQDLVDEANAYTDFKIGGVGGAGYVFTQATPSASWVITNPLSRIPAVELYNVAGARIVADIVVSTPTPTTVTVTFNTPIAGKAVLL